MYCIVPMTRTQRLRTVLKWPQWRMAEYLGVSQPTVTRLERGQAETGPISRLLDLLEAEIARRPFPAPDDSSPGASLAGGTGDASPPAPSPCRTGAAA
jgi:transcriptional regulator with XRE-family HTH domain